MQIKYLLSLDKENVITDELNFLEKALSKLNSFKFRGLLFSVMSSLTKKPLKNLNGYSPLKSDSICENGPKCKNFKNGKLLENKNKINDFSSIQKINEVLGDMKNRVIFVTSPFYNKLNPAVNLDIDIIGTAVNKLKESGYKVFDYRQNKRFVNVDEYFSDSVHLNYRGANLFSRILMRDIQEL